MSDIDMKPKIKMADEYSQLNESNLFEYYVPHFRHVAEICLKRAIDGLLNDPMKRSLTVGDYAACDGKTLMCIAELIIEYVQQRRGCDFPVTIIYEDLPQNNFNALFQTIDGPLSLQKKHRNLHILASGTGFYHQCVADATMDIILCNFGVNWLSALPCQAKATIFPHLSHDEREITAFSETAAADWVLFLELRAKELCKGGVLLVGMDMMHDGKYFIDDAVDAACKLLIENDTITLEELERCTLPIYFRTSDEMRKPFTDENSRIMNAGLRRVAEYVKHQTFIDDGLEKFITDLMYLLSSTVENFLHYGLAGNPNSKEETLTKLRYLTGEAFRKNGFGTLAYVVQVIEKA